MADSAWVPGLASDVPATRATPRHTAVVRVTHWISTLCFFALLVSGIEIVISHPRFYWGEVGNVLTPSLFDLPIPASRSAVQTGYGYVLPDQNGWSRSLHFQSAWILIFTGLLYVLFGFVTRHFARNLFPARADLSARALWKSLVDHLPFKRQDPADDRSYNVLQRIAYVFVIFVVFPLTIWTGLAMSPAVTSAFPFTVTVFGGQQSARTLHFFATIVLVLFLLVHVVEVWRAGFRKRMRPMLTGRASVPKEHA